MAMAIVTRRQEHNWCERKRKKRRGQQVICFGGPREEKSKASPLCGSLFASAAAVEGRIPNRKLGFETLRIITIFTSVMRKDQLTISQLLLCDRG